MATPASITWIPSTARVILLDGFGIVPRGNFQVAPQPLIWPAKDPADILDYILDVSEALAGSEGDSITTLDVQIAPAMPGDLVLNASSSDGSKAIVWLAEGIAGTTYSITLNIGTQSGRMIARTVTLPVLALTTNAVGTNAITDQAGQPITDQSDAPLIATS